jgi:hypothetical protein
MLDITFLKKYMAYNLNSGIYTSEEYLYLAQYHMQIRKVEYGMHE